MTLAQTKEEISGAIGRMHGALLSSAIDCECRDRVGKALRDQRLLLIPEESWSPPVLRRAWLHASRLARPALVAL